MCISFMFVGDESTPYHYIVGFNRDEFMDRGTEAAHRWKEYEFRNVFAGRDLAGKGTWLGMRADLRPTRAEQAKIGKAPKPADCDVDFRIGLLTNVRENTKPSASGKPYPTRGHLITSYLSEKNKLDPKSYAEQVLQSSEEYAGFNLLVGDAKQLYCVSNRNGASAVPLNPGIHGISNGSLNDSWPKLVRGKAEFEKAIHHHITAAGKMQISGEGCLVDKIFEILGDSTPCGDASSYPGVYPVDAERKLSSIFVKQFGLKDKSFYGTRCSSVIIVRRNGTISYTERNNLKDQVEWDLETYRLNFKPMSE